MYGFKGAEQTRSDLTPESLKGIFEPRKDDMDKKDKKSVDILITDNGTFPNNGRLPLLVLPGAVSGEPGEELARRMEDTFARNSWPPSWRNGVFSYHHYHSTAHETLGVYAGRAVVLFGGDDGVEREVTAGDVVVIPAGVSHKLIEESRDFRVVGAYPPGQSPDMNYGKEGERPGTDRSIDELPLPEQDPAYGEGPLLGAWK
jgi:uncharacterized protein YjlB